MSDDARVQYDEVVQKLYTVMAQMSAIERRTAEIQAQIGRMIASLDDTQSQIYGLTKRYESHQHGGGVLDITMTEGDKL